MTLERVVLNYDDLTADELDAVDRPDLLLHSASRDSPEPITPRGVLMRTYHEILAARARAEQRAADCAEGLASAQATIADTTDLAATFRTTIDALNP